MPVLTHPPLSFSLPLFPLISSLLHPSTRLLSLPPFLFLAPLFRLLLLLLLLLSSWSALVSDWDARELSGPMLIANEAGVVVSQMSPPPRCAFAVLSLGQCT